MEADALFDPSFFISFSFVTRGVATGLQPYICKFLHLMISVLLLLNEDSIFFFLPYLDLTNGTGVL